MTTKDENLDLALDGSRYCTRFRLKQNTTSVYLKLDPTNGIDVIFVRIVGRRGDNSNFENFTYMTDSFSITAGKKYMLYNTAPANTEVRLEFEGSSIQNIHGVWSPDSVPDKQAITIGPNYKPGNPNTKDEEFCFTANNDGQEFTTNFRDKNTSSSVYLNLLKSNFSGTIEVSVIGKSVNDEANCTNRVPFYQLESGRKYELYNTVRENSYSQAALHFKLSRGVSVTGLWSPDYSKEAGVIVVGGRSMQANTKDTSFCFTLSGCARTEDRMKMNSSSVYLKVDELSAPVQLRVLGMRPGRDLTNETNRAEYYTIAHTGKYELYNTVIEHGNESVVLEFSGPQGTKVRGVWSPDYAFDPQCETLGTSSQSAAQAARIEPVANAKKLISVPFISQQGIPTGCESVSATMVLQHWGFEIRPYDFITRYLPKLAVNAYPDPNSYFVGNPYSQHAYGCFAPCIRRAISNVVGGSNFDVIDTSGRDLRSLCAQFIDSNKPVIIWATMGMRETRMGSSSWTIRTVNEDAKYKKGDKFLWPGNEHCLVLVGYSDTHYAVNDPLAGIGQYPRDLLEKRFAEQGKQSVVLTPRGTAVTNPQPMKLPPAPVDVQKQMSVVDRVVKGAIGAAKVAGGVSEVVSGGLIIADTGGVAALPGYAVAMFGVNNTVEGVQDIVNACVGNDAESFNALRDFVFQGNQILYDITDIALSLGASGIAKSLKNIGKPPAVFSAKPLQDVELSKYVGGLPSPPPKPIPHAIEQDGKVIWGLSENGMMIYDRYYTEHALQRMAPRTDDVMWALKKRYMELNPYKGWPETSKEFQVWSKNMHNYMQPRNIPPMVIEDIIKTEPKLPNYQLVKKTVNGKEVTERVLSKDTVKYMRKIEEGNWIKVILNDKGHCVSIMYGNSLDKYEVQDCIKVSMEYAKNICGDKLIQKFMPK